MNCSKHHAESPAEHLFFGRNSTPEERERAVWAAIDRSFSSPANAAEDTSEYLPTQILAELFRKEGFDGILYKSKFGEKGFNVALFKLSDARLVMCELNELKEVQYKFEMAGNPYLVADPDTTKQENRT